MSTYEAISIMIMFSIFTISLISLIVSLIKDDNKGKK
ncbi:MAG: putative holin-like toxin [Clostridiaceae bacterium]|nr:putative holin-like toxin [Clostridiaceae bacterium]